jgi:hypothetical protein
MLKGDEMNIQGVAVKNQTEGNKMLKTSELSIGVNSEGAWVISAVIGYYLETRRYYDYTKKEAIALFKSEFSN